MARDAGGVRLLLADWTKVLPNFDLNGLHADTHSQALTSSVKELTSRYKAVAEQLDRLPDEDQMDEEEVTQSRASHRELQNIKKELGELAASAKGVQEDLESIVKAANTRLDQVEDASRTLDNLRPVVDDWLRWSLIFGIKGRFSQAKRDLGVVLL